MIATSHLRSWLAKAWAQWSLLSVVLLILAGCLGVQNGLGRIDQTLYDWALVRHPQSSDPRIVIVAIDDISIGQIGRWPWPRNVHAALLEKLSAAQPAAIGVDILFSEPEGDGSSDLLLAQALARSGKTVLPIVVEGERSYNLRASLPLPQLAQNAAALGHIHVELDSDSVVRSAFLEEGQGEHRWSHFSLALLKVAGWWPAQAALPGRINKSAFNDSLGTTGWQRNYWTHIPFALGSLENPAYTTVSYAAVLRGEVPDTLLRDKIILVGATATGLWDAFPTPFSGQGRAMPGIEVSANLLNALLHERTLTPAPPWLNGLYCMLPVAVTMLALFWLRPRNALLVNLSCIALTIMLSALLLGLLRLWFAPGAAILPLLLAYPLWSWRRLDASLRYMQGELQQLEQEPDVLPVGELPNSQAMRVVNNNLAAGVWVDAVDTHMQSLQFAIARVRDLRQFVTDSLESLPDATLISTTDGNILVANRQAREWFKQLGVEQIDNAQLPYLLTHYQAQDSRPDFSWWHLLDSQRYQQYASGLEARDKLGRDVMIHNGPATAHTGALLGWITSLIDISPMRAAERQRDETLRFLSHDIRSPLSSIIALTDLQRTAATALPLEEYFKKVERQAHKSLALADDFVQLARAETRDYQFAACTIEDIFDQAIDDSYALASQHQCKIETDFTEQECLFVADRHLLLRVLQNLLSNAIKYSPTGRTVHCWTRIQPNISSADLIVGVRDEGYGIAPEDQSKLFRRFTRLQLPDQPRIEGIGLGLVFVKTVVEKHMGKIEFTSNPGVGTEFRLRFPVRLV